MYGAYSGFISPTNDHSAIRGPRGQPYAPPEHLDRWMMTEIPKFRSITSIEVMFHALASGLMIENVAEEYGC
jgi:hypothetical protein